MSLVPKLPKRLSLALRIGVSTVLIALMLSRLELGDMRRFLVRADGLLVGLTLVMVAMDRCLMATRWMVLLEALGVHPRRLQVVKIFFLSTFFGSFLPSGIGGEAVRAISSTRLTEKGVESVASVAMDRLLGMLSMLLTALVSLAVFFRVYPHPALLVVVLGLSVAAGAGLTLLLSPSFHQWASSRIRRRSLASVHRMIEALARYRSRPGLLALVLGMSTGVQVLRILQAYVLSEALSLGTPLLYFFCFVPPILIVTMLPISVSGLGTTNLAYVALFSQVGMDPDGAFVLSLLVLALGVLGNLPGGAIYALEGFAPAESAGPSNGNHGNLERAGLFQSER